MSYLLDTNVVSEVRKPKGSVAVKKWVQGTPAAEIFLSVLVLGEIRDGIERKRRRDPRAAEAFESWLADLQSWCQERILPIDGAVAEEWGRLNAAGPLPIIDGLLAATAKVHGHTLVTRNVADVARGGIAVLNPFAE